MNVRPAQESEVDRLATIWFDGWQDAHARILPAELAAIRTWESFRERLLEALPRTGAIGPVGAPLGFYIVKGDELYQLYVAGLARGSGAAAQLIAAAEDRMAGDGVEVAWLACAIGNDRAARFYEKRGWFRTGTIVSVLDTPAGFPLEVWRYEKRLGG